MVDEEEKVNGNLIHGSQVFQFMFTHPNKFDLFHMKQGDNWCLDLMALIDNML